MSDRQPWLCPGCGRYHAPWKDTCDASPLSGPGLFAKPLPQQCPGCKGPCANAACPLLPKVTATKAITKVM